MQTKQELEEWYRVPDPWEYQIKYDDTYRKQQILNILHDRVYDNVIDIGCGEGWITTDLPGNIIHGIELSDMASSRFPHNVTRVSEPELMYDLVITTGTLYRQYNHKQIANWIQQCASKHILIGGIESWLVSDYEFGKLINEVKFPYRDYIQVLRLYEVHK